MKTLFTSIVFVFLALACCQCRSSGERAERSGATKDCAVVAATDVNDAASTDSELRQEFQQLLRQWDEHRRSPHVTVSSNMTVDFDCEAYLEMVRLGRPLLPLAIEEMKGGHNWLFHVVKDITGLTPRDIEQELDVSFEGNLTYLYVLWWEIEGRKACRVDSSPEN